MAAFARAATAAGSGSSPSPRGAPARQAHRIRISGSEISQLILRRRGRADLGGVSLKCSEPTRVADSTASSSSPSLPAAAVTSAVEVRVYNIDRYGMSPMASRVLKKEVDGIYHVGITAFGNEYW